MITKLDVPLTPREEELLRLLVVCHKANQQKLANMMGIAYDTLTTHRKNLYRKINVQSRLEATLYGMRLYGGQNGKTS